MKSSKNEKSGKYVSENKSPLVAIATKVTVNERDRITQAAANRKMSTSEYLKWCALNQEWDDITMRVTAADWQPK